MILTPTPTAVKPSSIASQRTIQRRNGFLKQQLETTSGGVTDYQTGRLVKSLSKFDRQEVLKQSNIDGFYIDAEQLVAMKSDLGLSWEKMKTMTKYLLLQLKFSLLLLFSSNCIMVSTFRQHQTTNNELFRVTGVVIICSRRCTLHI